MSPSTPPQDRWRDPSRVATHSAQSERVDPKLLRAKALGAWWDYVERSGVTVIVGREYEHFLLGLSIWKGRPHVSYLPMPHPSGLAFDPAIAVLYVASTRNPNIIFSLEPITALLPLHWRRKSYDLEVFRPLAPRASTVFPGSLYLHDLALVGGVLHGTAAGRNTLVSLADSSCVADVWWPQCVTRNGAPMAGRNYIQLNSIAAGATPAQSYFTASSAHPSNRRPGHRNFAVDRRGVLFDGFTREPMTAGLTRPHSARFARSLILIANSGYGELVAVEAGKPGYSVICRLPGWTRGLAIVDDTALVATSRILPGYEQYAPGITPSKAVCGLHAVNIRSGVLVGSLVWPMGDQIFGVESIPRAQTHGFLSCAMGSGPRLDSARIMYGYSPSR